MSEYCIIVIYNNCNYYVLHYITLYTHVYIYIYMISIRVIRVSSHYPIAYPRSCLSCQSKKKRKRLPPRMWSPQRSLGLRFSPFGGSSSSWGHPNSWMVFLRENPSKNGWFRGTPISGNHLYNGKSHLEMDDDWGYSMPLPSGKHTKSYWQWP